MTKADGTSPEGFEMAGRSKPPSLLLLFGIFLALAGGLFLAETAPRFIDLPIRPPDYYEGGLSGNWMDESRTVLTLPPSTIPDSRGFILRRETMVTYDQAHNIISWSSIIEYFDSNLSQLGWVRSENYAPCQTYLPEADFLPENAKNGYVNYRRKEYRASYDLEEGDVICLAVWESSPGLFNIVFLTARPSYFTILSHLLF